MRYVFIESSDCEGIIIRMPPLGGAAPRYMAYLYYTLPHRA